MRRAEHRFQGRRYTGDDRPSAERYVANYRDIEDLASGIHWVLEEADRAALKQACLQKVAQSYSQHAVALKYIEVYNEAMAYKNYKL